MLKRGWRWEGRPGHTTLVDPEGSVAGTIGSHLPDGSVLWAEAYGYPSRALGVYDSIDEAREALARLVGAWEERLSWDATLVRLQDESPEMGLPDFADLSVCCRSVFPPPVSTIGSLKLEFRRVLEIGEQAVESDEAGLFDYAEVRAAFLAAVKAHVVDGRSG